MKIKGEFTFPGKLKEEAVICNLCKKFEIVLNIIEASFSTDIGWSILIFEGAEEELKKVVTYLKDIGVKFENLKTIT